MHRDVEQALYEKEQEALAEEAARAEQEARAAARARMEALRLREEERRNKENEEFERRNQEKVSGALPANAKPSMRVVLTRVFATNGDRSAACVRSWRGSMKQSGGA